MNTSVTLCYNDGETAIFKEGKISSGKMVKRIDYSRSELYVEITFENEIATYYGIPFIIKMSNTDN